MHISTMQWVVMALGAFGIGLSKTGIAGFGIVAVALFSIVLPAKASVGIVLPVLVCGDICAVSMYRRKAVWRHLITLLPWAAVGVGLGYLALGRIDNTQTARLIGAILIVLAGVQTARRIQSRRVEEQSIAELGIAQSHATVAVMGILAGFTTMVANAAGPIMILYLLSTRLPKLEFVGTGAWFFFILNLFKLPFSANLGLINAASLTTDAFLVPAVVAGALCGRALLQKIDQKLFENLALVLTVAAAIKLLAY